MDCAFTTQSVRKRGASRYPVTRKAILLAGVVTVIQINTIRKCCRNYVHMLQS